MVQNKTAEVPDLDVLPENEQWKRVTQRNAHYMERMASIANRDIHSERGIDTTGLESTTIPATIARRNWYQFTSPPWAYHPGLVREFYAAMIPKSSRPTALYGFGRHRFRSHRRLSTPT